MTNFLNKLFLCGILLSSVNYELAYSQTLEAAGTFNLGVDFENNIASTDNKLDTDMEIKWNKTIGAYDTSKYKIETNESNQLAIYNNKVGKFAAFKTSDGLGVSPYWKSDGENYYMPIDFVNSWTGEHTFRSATSTSRFNLKLYFLQSDELKYDFSSNTIRGSESFPNLFNIECTDYDVNKKTAKLKISKLSDDIKPDSLDYIGQSITVHLIDLNDGYSISSDKLTITSNTFGQYLTKPNTNTMKWYKDQKSYVELNKAIFTITADGELTLSETDNNKATSLTVTNFGQLINNGKIIANNNTSILGPAVLLGTEPNQWERSISNLEDVAINNSNGEIILKAGSTINDINNSGNSIIQGGTVDISDLIDWSSSNITIKTDDPHVKIKSAFYNVNIKLLPDDLTNTNNLISYFNDDTNFTSDSKYLLGSMKFFSDITDGSDNVTESRHSTITMPGGLSISANLTENNDKYSVSKPVITASGFNVDNVLKLFYTAEKISTFQKNNYPLRVDSTAVNVSLYDLLANPKSYINDISVDTINNKQLNSYYGLELLPFIKNDNNVIDYNKFDENAEYNLDRVQFVSDKDETNSLELTLSPKYVIDPNNTEEKIYNTEIDMKSTYNNWKGVVDPNVEKVIINTGTNIIKAHDYMFIETKGDVNLLLDNEGELNLCQLFNNGTGKLSVSQYNYGIKHNNPLIIRLVAKDYEVLVNSSVTINPPISVHFVKDGIISSAKVYKEIKDLTYKYMEEFVKYNAIEDKTVSGAKDALDTAYTNISDSTTGVLKKLEPINSELNEIEDNTSTTDYAKYFGAIGDNGANPTDTTNIKQYNDIKETQDKLIKINGYKIQALTEYLRVLNNQKTIETDQTTFQTDNIDPVTTNIGTAKTNQIKMLKNKWQNSSSTDKVAIAAEITALGGTVPTAS